MPAAAPAPKLPPPPPLKLVEVGEDMELEVEVEVEVREEVDFEELDPVSVGRRSWILYAFKAPWLGLKS
jgi:hypothetical protein